MDELRPLLEQTAQLAASFYDTLDERPVFPRTTAEELRDSFGRSLPEEPTDAQTVIAELANGSIGYVPTRVAYSQGNYEVVSARCAEGSGEKLVDVALRLLRSQFKK